MWGIRAAGSGSDPVVRDHCTHWATRGEKVCKDITAVGWALMAKVQLTANRQKTIFCRECVVWEAECPRLSAAHSKHCQPSLTTQSDSCWLIPKHLFSICRALRQNCSIFRVERREKKCFYYYFGVQAFHFNSCFCLSSGEDSISMFLQAVYLEWKHSPTLLQIVHWSYISGDTDNAARVWQSIESANMVVCKVWCRASTRLKAIKWSIILFSGTLNNYVESDKKPG